MSRVVDGREWPSRRATSIGSIAGSISEAEVWPPTRESAPSRHVKACARHRGTPARPDLGRVSSADLAERLPEPDMRRVCRPWHRSSMWARPSILALIPQQPSTPRTLAAVASRRQQTTLAVMLGNKRQLGQVLCRSEQASLNRGRTTARRRVSATRNGFHLSVSPSNPMAGPRSPSNGFIVEEHASRAHLRVPIKDKLLKG